jgi:hypothetical protein
LTLARVEAAAEMLIEQLSRPRQTNVDDPFSVTRLNHVGGLGLVESSRRFAWWSWRLRHFR